MTKEFETFKKKLLQDPSVAAEYEKCNVEYSIAKALIRSRLKAKMTQSEVAEKMHTSQSQVARLESGIHLPSLKTLHKYADAIKAPIHLDIYPDHG